MTIGSIFKYPIRFAAGRLNIRTENFTKVGDDYYGFSNGTTDRPFPPLSLPAFVADTDYWLGGGDPDFDLLVIWEAMDIGLMTLVTEWGGFIAGVPFAEDFQALRCLFAEDTGGATHEKILWTDAATTVDGLIFGFNSDSQSAPQPVNGNDRVIAHGTKPPQVFRLEYLPSDDSLTRTPVVVGKVKTLDGNVESAFYGVAQSIRSLSWAA